MPSDSPHPRAPEIGTSHLDELLASMRRLERRLFAHVLGSFAFTLLAVLAQPESFGVSFKALTELIGGITGAAGILCCYLNSSKELKDQTNVAILRSSPARAGFRTALLLVASAGSYYGFYSLAAATDQNCIWFLGVGNFLFFYGLASAALAMYEEENRLIIWRSLSPSLQREWLLSEAERIRRNQLLVEKAEEEMEAARQGYQEKKSDALEWLERVRRENELEEAERRREERRKRREAWWEKYFWKPTLTIRKRFRLIRETETEAYLRREEIRKEELLKELLAMAVADAIREIGEGKHPPLKLEGMEVRVFQVRPYTYVESPSGLTKADAERLLEALKKSLADEKGMLRNVILFGRAESGITLEAFTVLRVGGVEVHLSK